MNTRVVTKTAEETVELAEKISRQLDKGDFIALIGQLGAGKTVFSKGVARGLDVVDYDYVNSPSFVILKEYCGRHDLYHFDVYRLSEKQFCDTLDYEKYFYGKGITVVEWANKISDVLPDEYLEVKIEYGENDTREITVTSVGKKNENISI